MGRLTQTIRALGLLMGLGIAAQGCANTLSQAQVAYDNGEYEDAETLYKQTMAQGDGVDAEIAREELFDMHMEQAKALKGKGKRTEEQYRKALALQPDSGEAREGLAQSLIALYRHDEAMQILEEGVANRTCKGCQRLMAVLLIQRADNQAVAGNWAEAETDYAAATRYLPDPAVELSLARARMAVGKVEEAAAGLKTIAPKIGVDSVGLRTQFLEVRRAVVLACLGSDKIELADEMVDVAPEGVSGEEQLGLAVEVAMEFSRLGKAEEALSRMQSVVQAADAGKLIVSDTRKAELRDRVADLLAARAATALANGDTAGARADIDEALKLRPANTRALLQNVLLLAGEDKLSAGKAELAKVDVKVVGRTQVDAILHAMEVPKMLAAGRTADAKRELDLAKAIDADVPEVHVAEAQVLAATPVAGLSKADVKLLKAGWVAYPGEPTGVGEALSELSWARKQIEGQGDVYPFRAPNMVKQMQTLEDGLRRYYPFAVGFQPDPVAMFVVSSKSGAAASVLVEGKGVREQVDVPTGGSTEVRAGPPGVVTVTVGGVAKALLAEPYTQVQLAL